jgi:lipopolysaccharide transport system ATP-binding protein
MSSIKAIDLVVEFPTYTSAHRSLKKAILHATTGGRIARDSHDRLTFRGLDGINVSVESGERVGLMGHNGSGKTTLLRVLAGAYEPIAGELEVEGHVASLLDISMGMDGEATGYENIFLRGLMMGMRPNEIRQSIGDIEEFTELGEYLDMPMRTYSSGMQLRLAFGVSTSVTADILLMDEWLSVGDEGFQKKASQRLETLVAQTAILVLASHSEELIKKVCTRLLRLEHDRIIEDKRLG